ncbi:Hypothetical_protein [Hexamita inflata]|uniref:Hypothetical_protein n=1 Tax=Hexamita inflata TaxID=28002 RepID=A0AA86NAU4_9EUKA|nr:Hypothetical protein HINF_LOCUS3560 [Hexamita inflata]
MNAFNTEVVVTTQLRNTPYCIEQHAHFIQLVHQDDGALVLPGHQAAHQLLRLTRSTWTADVEEAEMMKKVHSDASALVRKYFPLPGAEKNKHPFHGYRFLFKICFGFSSPTSLNDCLGCSVRIMLENNC